MNTRSIIASALVLAFAAAGASAQEATPDVPQPYAGNVTRAQVIAELQQARANGALLVSEQDRQAWPAFASTRSRAEVRAEVAAAAGSGELRALHAETNSFDGRPEFAARRDASSLVAGTPTRVR